MKSVKRLVSSVLVLGVLFSLSGCKGEEPPPRDPDKMDTVTMLTSNKLAKGSVNDVAVRYFYLINSGNFDEAVDLLALDDTDIMSGSILDRLYKSATNFPLSSDYRVYGVDSVLSSYDKVEGYEDYTVTIQYANIKDTSFEAESSLAEGEEPPPSVIVPSIDQITFASNYQVEDYDSDDYLTEKDMKEYDKEYEESQAEINEQEQYGEGVVSVEPAGYSEVSYKTARLTEKDMTDNSSTDATEVSNQSGVNVDESGVNQSGYGTVKETNDVYNLKSTEIKVRRYVASDDMLKQEGMLESSVSSSQSKSNNKDKTKSSKASEVTSSAVESSKESSEESSEESSGVSNEAKYICKVVLPDSFWNNSSVMFVIPTNAKLMLDDVVVSTKALDLEDWYVLKRVPQLSNWTLRIKTDVDTVLTRDIDLTYRVAYAFQWIQPSRSCKESALVGAKSVMQSMFTSLEKKQSFDKSDFVKKSVGKQANKSEFKSYYDAVLANKSNATNMTVVSVKTEDEGLSTLSMGIYDSRYISIPVVLDYSYKTEDEVIRRTAEGVIHLTKEGNTWKLWNISQELVDIW